MTELEEFGRIAETPAPPAQLDSGALYSGAGFASAPPDPSAIEPGLRELIQVLERQTRDLESLRRELQNHPARKWSGHRDEVLEVICRFELARAVRREGPILNASEQLVGDLLQGRLAPIVRELVGSIVRFEWYSSHFSYRIKAERSCLAVLRRRSLISTRDLSSTLLSALRSESPGSSPFTCFSTRSDDQSWFSTIPFLRLTLPIRRGLSAHCVRLCD